MDEAEGNLVRQPKLFVSYSWTSSNHVEWVMQLATDLRANGVDAIVDLWHLKEGQDAHSFMEQMVRDENIEKVILVCDKKYVERADARKGGVGVESQIITKSIYGDVSQTKFVALALDSDEGGSALLPNFVQSRIYLDFRNQDQYAENLKKLLRWIFDKPLYIPPDIGERPTFIDEQVSLAPSSLATILKVPPSTVSGESHFLSFWRQATKAHTDFTLDLAQIDDADQIVVDTIMAMPPLISQLVVSVRDEIERDTFRAAYLDQIRDFFEKCLAHYGSGSTNWGADATKFFSEFLFVSIIAIFLRFRKFDYIERLLSEPFLKMQYDNVTAKAISFTELNSHIPSLDHRNQRLNLNRASLRADTVRDVVGLVPLEFWEYLQADFFLFLYCQRRIEGATWWPDSNIYAADRDGAYPIFVRAQKSSGQEDLLSILDLDTRAKLEAFAAELRTERYARYRWRSAFSTLRIGALANIDAILASRSADQA